ncbi:HNH endonuclease [Tundrisphaera sp. TA3]|uniref:HNH endonuclease n=1 Tax=Tundrisphaera sp. TA3 TaxID=3435775 RepID=UPI003EB751C2
MNADVRAFIRERAGNRCEYCRLHQVHVAIAHHIEHVIARQHGGDDSLDNLALSCARCNSFKGPNLSGIDPDRGQHVPLFHPRRHVWEEHFAFQAYRLVGLTPIGRATVHVLGMNETRRLELRALLIAAGESL